MVVTQVVDDLLDELVAEVDTGKARLRGGDGVEDRGVRVVDRLLPFEQVRQVVGEAARQRDSTNTIGSLASAGWKKP